jgi:tRNA nucleotidyltransferase (CCA-adding enzyme)
MALHLNPASFGELLDLYGGREDLERGLIRILHEESFRDDPTRILRALRYEQRLDFRLEGATEGFLRRDVGMMAVVSGDRLRHELELILQEERPEMVLARAGELGALQGLHPTLRGNGWLKEKFEAARRREGRPEVGLYLCLLTYHLSREERADLIARLRLPRDIARSLMDTLRLKGGLPALEEGELPRSALYQRLQPLSPRAILACLLASESLLVRERLELYLTSLRFVRTSLTGEDLKALGVNPGPRLGRLLRMLLEAKLDGRVGTRQEEENRVRSWLK